MEATLHNTDTSELRSRGITVRDAFAAASRRVSFPVRQPHPAREAAEQLSASLRSLILDLPISSAERQQVSGEPLRGAQQDDAREDAESTDQPLSGEVERAEIPLQVENASVNRAQIRQRFLDLHFGTSNLAPFVFVHEVFNTDHQQQVATTTAVDTMCIAQMATSFQDSRLMDIAGRMYSRVARAISRKLERLTGASETGSLDDLFGGIHALITCGFFSGLHISAADRECHVQGLKHMTKSISNDRMSDHVREAFKHKWGRQGFWLAIKQRKDLSKVDSRLDFADRWRITDSESLSRLASQVPGLLERVDAFFTRRSRNSRVSPRELLAFLTELEATVANLKRWQLQWESIMPSPYQLRSIRSFESFRGISGPYFEVFKTAYSFSKPADERDFRVLQICLISLDLSIIQLHQAFPRHLIDPEVQVQRRRADFGVEMAAEALCMMVPWTSRPENMAFAGVYSMPLLERAMPYFQANGKTGQVEWCRTVSRSLGDTHGVDFFVGQG